MTAVREARESDLDWLSERDRHVAPGRLAEVVLAGRVLLALDHDEPIGWARWGLFWDEIPFLNMLVVDAAHRGRGVGSRLMAEWEAAMRARGHTLALTSTMSNETAQDFYRRLGYRDAGGLLLPDEPTELLLVKSLSD